MNMFRPRQPRRFQLEYHYARPKRLISDSLDDRPSAGRRTMLTGALMLLLLIAVLLLLQQLLANA